MHLYLGNLSYLTTAEELAALLAPFGPFAAPRLVLDPATGLSRGYALAEFDDPAAAEAAAAALNGSFLHGRVLIVRPAHAGE
ncbi:MAG: RNA-binding protein [Dehalococcoidia bacterium]|nr:RNA-binding protein [Dehalococcoidia bacterium]